MLIQVDVGVAGHDFAVANLASSMVCARLLFNRLAPSSSLRSQQEPCIIAAFVCFRKLLIPLYKQYHQRVNQPMMEVPLTRYLRASARSDVMSLVWGKHGARA